MEYFGPDEGDMIEESIDDIARLLAEVRRLRAALDVRDQEIVDA